jgi:hypothetical protein
LSITINFSPGLASLPVTTPRNDIFSSDCLEQLVSGVDLRDETRESGKVHKYCQLPRSRIYSSNKLPEKSHLPHQSNWRGLSRTVLERSSDDPRMILEWS